MSMGAVALPVLENPAHPLRKKLWLASGAISLFVLTVVIGNAFVERRNAITADAVGHDFIAFYTAGHFLREGQTERIYDLEAVRKYQQELGQANHLELKKQSFGPFWNPPFYAWLFVPLAGLPFRTALAVWWAFNLVCLSGAMILLCRMLCEGGDWKIIGLVPAILLNSLPFHQALNHGQNTFGSLLILTGTVWFWKKGSGFWAGIVCGLLFYKPQLGAIVAVVLVLSLGWRALVGVGVTSLVLLLVTVISLPGLIPIYLAKMPGNLAWMQETNSYLWERHVTLKAMWRLMIQGHGTGETFLVVKILWIASVAVIGGGLCWVVWKQKQSLTGVPGEGKEPPRAGLIAATIVAMPLLMPFYFDYDLLLLAVAAVLFAADMLAKARMADEDRWLVRAWIALFVIMFFNSSVSGIIRLHLAVIALTAVALLHIRRALRIQVDSLKEIA